HGKVCRKGACQPPVPFEVDLLQTGATIQNLLSALTPVVEVARHKQWRARRNLPLNKGAQGLQLRRALPLPQAQVYADRVYVEIQHRRSQYAVQQAAALMLSHRNIDVVVGRNGKLGKNRVTVVPIGIDGVAPIGEFRPNGVGQEFVLADGRPPGQPLRMAVMRPQHFLKKNDVGVRRADRFTPLVQDKTWTEERRVGKGESLPSMPAG